MAEKVALALRELQNAEVVRVELTQARARFDLAVAGLRDDLSMVASWRAWVQRHPWLSIAGALVAGAAAGAIVGTLTSRSNHGRQRDDSQR